MGATGSAAWRGLTRTKSAPSSSAPQAASCVRSVRSPIPHESSDRTWYSCVISPQLRLPAGARSGSRRPRGHDEHRRGGSVPGPGVHGVPAHGEVLRESDGRPPDQVPVHLARLDPDIDRSEVVPRWTHPPGPRAPTRGRRAARGPPSGTRRPGASPRWAGASAARSGARARRVTGASPPGSMHRPRDPSAPLGPWQRTPSPGAPASPSTRPSRRGPRRGPATSDRARPGAPRSHVPLGHQQSGCRCAHGRASSSWPPRESRVASSPGRPMSCTPIGRPPADQPSGKDNAGCPVTLYGAVKGVKRF